MSRVEICASYLLEQQPESPACYLLALALQHGRGASNSGGVPSTETRIALKQAREAGNWGDVLAQSLRAMLDGGATRWLDVHYHVWQAAENLGAGRLQALVMGAVEARLADISTWPQESFDDDTPVASVDTQRWVQRHLNSRRATSITEAESAPAEAATTTESDAIVARAREAAARGETEQAVGLLMESATAAQSGRDRFLLRMEVCRVCMQAGQKHIAAHMLRQMLAEADDLRLEHWEGRALPGALLGMLLHATAGHALLALLSEEGLARMLAEISGELRKIPFASIVEDFEKVTEDSVEAKAAKATIDTEQPKSDAVPAHTPFLDRYTVDLTREAREGRTEVVVGRDVEIRQMIDVLLRRRQNNPILTGEAGVGKTAVVEGLARKIADGDVPPVLANVRLLSLDLSLLQAGASVKGEFENRLKGLVQEVKASPQPVILFIDEAHALVGAGGSAGQGDAANILKPALARGELRTIAATTWAEYKRFFEKDAALARRFQVIKVDEPSEELCEAMLHAILPSLETHHGARILDEAIKAAVYLSHRYLPGRQLPDKAVAVLDTACARVALSRSALPTPIESLMRTINMAETQKRILSREQATGAQHAVRIEECDERIRSAGTELERLRLRWNEEIELSEQMEQLHLALDPDSACDAGTRSAALNCLAAARTELRALQGQTPLIHLAVDAQLIATVMAEWTGIPLGKMLDDEVVKLLRLESALKKRIVGQDHALSAIAQRIWTSRANLDDPGKPTGVFLLAGPSGVGKTETALALADLLYGGEHNMISINMSEFQESHSVSTLKGAPPGYVGYGEGGVLTEAVRRQPYSVVLLDELEKAHPDVLELFFQVFDKGYIEDGEGRWIDFRNTLILLTTKRRHYQAVCRSGKLPVAGCAWKGHPSIPEPII